jgi:hypothetical protein
MCKIGRQYRGCKFDQINVRKLGSKGNSVEILARTDE